MLSRIRAFHESCANLSCSIVVEVQKYQKHTLTSNLIKELEFFPSKSLSNITELLETYKVLENIITRNAHHAMNQLTKNKNKKTNFNILVNNARWSHQKLPCQ